jgi:hypothetical protein
MPFQKQQKHQYTPNQFSWNWVLRSHQSIGYSWISQHSVAPKGSTVHTIPSYPSNIHLNIIPHLHVSLSIGPFSSGFPTKTLYTFLLSPMHVTCPVHIILLDLIILIIYDKLWSSSLCSFLQPISWPFFDLLSTLLSKSFSLCSFNTRNIH